MQIGRLKRHLTIGIVRNAFQRCGKPQRRIASLMFL
jgi:hypothetical protein